MTENFYALLNTVDEFIDLTAPNNYVSVPKDWYIIITDVVGSTKAIESGRYKDINLLGASSIIAVLNAVKPLIIPYVFGGDGASIIIPPSVLYKSRDAVLAIRQLAKDSFKLDLRVGIVPVEAIPENLTLKIAKFKITPNYHQACFIGGGLTYATDLVKADSTYQLEVEQKTLKPDLSGLECRWQDVPSKYGETISLIIGIMPSSKKKPEIVYREVIEEINRIYGDTKDYHPIDNSKLKLTFNPQKLLSETKAKAKSNHWFARLMYLLIILLENVLGIILMYFKIHFGGVDWGDYKKATSTASDYQKIDDVLRMVIAGKPEQNEELRAYLEKQFQAGFLVYGLHISDRALMTCLIFERHDHHIHLIDGADGGYALAAKAFKTRLHRKLTNWRAYNRLLNRHSSRPNQENN